jgi:DNA-binding winged helix-turn-helix (wHTH) protein
LVPDTRIYLCGRVTVERNGRMASNATLGGRQGRLLFVFLGTRRTHAVSKAQVIEAVWGSRTPPSVETALDALVSKLRSALKRLGLARPHGLTIDVGTYQLVVPSVWVDVEAARAAIDRAEGAQRGDALQEAWAWANVAAAITRQPFCPTTSTRGFRTSVRSCTASGVGRGSCCQPSASAVASTNWASSMPRTWRQPSRSTSRRVRR